MFDCIISYCILKFGHPQTGPTHVRNLFPILIIPVFLQVLVPSKEAQCPEKEYLADYRSKQNSFPLSTDLCKGKPSVCNLQLLPVTRDVVKKREPNFVEGGGLFGSCYNIGGIDRCEMHLRGKVGTQVKSYIVVVRRTSPDIEVTYELMDINE